MSTMRTAVVVVVIVIVIAAALVLAAVNRPGGGTAAGAASGAEESAAEAKPVKVEAASVKTLQPYIDASGDVEASVNVAVYPDIGGKVVEYRVALGDHVEKGQAIATIDPSKPGSVYALSQAISPIAGTVTSILAQQGETVTSSSSLAKVGVVEDLKVVVRLAERDSARVARGMSAKIGFEALPGESFSASVSRVSPVLDPASRTREIWLASSSRDRRISAGMYAKVRLFTNPVLGQVVITSAAVKVRNGESFVFVVSNQADATTAEKRIVKTGTEVDGEVVVLSGLASGEKIVYEGQGGLSDGARIAVVNEAGK